LATGTARAARPPDWQAQSSGDRRSLGSSVRQLSKQLASDIRAAHEDLIDRLHELHSDWLNR
jgi:hypothetical protein